MRLEVTPSDGLVDEPWSIIVFDAPGRQQITVTVATQSREERLWWASAQFLAGEDGTVDLSALRPLGGSYDSTNPNDLITHMEPFGREPASFFATDDAADLHIEVRVEARGAEPVTTVVVRRFTGPGVERIPIDDAGVRGVLFEPTTDDARPGVLLLPDELDPTTTISPVAALLASKGYPALVLDYSGESALADGLADVPLETVLQAVGWMADRASIDRTKVAGWGLGRGAEALVAAASLIPDLDLAALIAVAPSCVAWQATSAGKAPPISSWSVKGGPVRYLPVRSAPGTHLLRRVKKRGGRSVSTLAEYTDAFNDTEAFRQAGLPIENIETPMLLLAGADDQRWPAAEMAELLYRARRSTGAAAHDKKLVFNDAGRLIRCPYLPATVNRSLDPTSGGAQLLGGTAAGTAHADLTAWKKVLEFLAETLGAVYEEF